MVLNTKKKYGVLDEDIYNFDESGFQMGVIATARVVTGIERRGRPLKKQPSNREWVTVIETISALGAKLDPLIIFSGKVHQQHWFKALQADEYRRWQIAVSNTGWTNDSIGQYWIEWFEKTTSGRTVGKYRMLVMDGHHSHNTPEFHDFCNSHNIVTIYLPPHSSHILQPLDVACFSPLKRAYGLEVEKLIMAGVQHVEKCDFLELFIRARSQVMTKANTRAGFRAAGIVPFDPSEALDKLRAPIETPPRSSPPLSQDLEYGWQPTTPRNIS